MPYGLILRRPSFCRVARLLSAISNGLKEKRVPMFSNGEESTEQEQEQASKIRFCTPFSPHVTPPRRGWTPHSPPFSCPRLHNSGSPSSPHRKSG